ncbi:MAG: UDP-N-acetylmuramoyl-L-alanyl-D-glutamate--2,6-diaminopimelate ligase [Saprospiraceae bacterium]
MNWSDFKKRIKFFDIKGNADFEVKGVDIDSRLIKTGYVFIAVKGISSDGHSYIDKAIENGADAIICEVMPEVTQEGIEYIHVENSAITAGEIANLFYGEPSKKLKLVGVTGTNGKTTTVTMLYRLVKALGYKAGLLSTVRNFIHDEEVVASHTTPDVIRVNQLLAAMVVKGCDFAFMEVSSHAMKQHRVHGIHFAGGVFTNITHDHLDYHGTFKDYLDCKKMFFDGLSKDAFAVINTDDRNGLIMVQNTKAKVVTFALRHMADIKGKIKANTLQGLILDINGVEVHSRLVGTFNAYNFIGIYATAIQLGFDPIEILAPMTDLLPVDGRFDTIYQPEKKVLGIVDYAHTPDALENVLETIKTLKTKEARIITIIGCGGDRDKTKRPIMARIAIQKSDLVIFTADNPRSEDPESILDDMMAELTVDEKKSLIRQVDRKEAIRTAGMLATRPGDIILVAGKGHENYQEIKGKRFPFDDKIILKEVLM